MLFMKRNLINIQDDYSSMPFGVFQNERKEVVDRLLNIQLPRVVVTKNLIWKLNSISFSESNILSVGNLQIDSLAIHFYKDKWYQYFFL